MKTRFIIRSILWQSAVSLGYIISGNHLFTLADYKAIEKGTFRASVLESPSRHSLRVQRIANLLSLTY